MLQFIKIVSLSTLSLTLFSCTCTSVKRNDFKEVLIDKDDVYKIIYYASLAGNSHNTQPWLVKVRNNSILEIYADTSRKLKVVDPNSRGLFISLGAFIENIHLAAGSLGFSANIRIEAKSPTDVLVATIELFKRSKTNFDLEEIEQRRTIRTPFSNTEISILHINQLMAEFNNVHFFSNESEIGKYISDKTLDAYTQQANNEAAKSELAKWIRFSNADVTSNRDGLTTAGMGIEGFGGFMVRHFFKPEDSKKQSFVDIGIEKTKDQVNNCGGWLLITQHEDTPECWINTGRIYEHINIRCRSMMIGLHPMNQMIEEKLLEEDASKQMDINGKIQFIARVGYVKEYPKAVSVRRTVSEFTEFE